MIDLDRIFEDPADVKLAEEVLDRFLAWRETRVTGPLFRFIGAPINRRLVKAQHRFGWGYYLLQSCGVEVRDVQRCLR